MNGFQGYLSAVALICAAMSLANLLLIRRRGISAILLSCAFLAFGATAWALKLHADQGWIMLGGAVVAALLGADFFIRAGKGKQ